MPNTMLINLQLSGSHAVCVRNGLTLYLKQLLKQKKKNDECGVESNTATIMEQVEAVLNQLTPQVDMFKSDEPEAWTSTTKVDTSTGEVLD